MRMPRVRFTVWGMMVAVAVALTLSVHPGCGLNDPSEDQIHEPGEKLVSGIEDWRTKRGRYPATLAEAGLYAPDARQDKFTYESDATGFGVRIGVADGSNYQHVYVSHGFRKWGYELGWHCMD